MCSKSFEFGYQSRLNLIIMPLTVLDNKYNEFIKTFNPKAKNPIKFMIGYSATLSVIRLLCLENLIKL